jgi:hypothetical protein
VENVVELFLGGATVRAYAQAQRASAVRTDITINTVDIILFGKTVKTITLKPRPGAGQGWVEQWYLDDVVRVSVGNKGSVFVHVREEDGTKDKTNDATASTKASSSVALARVEDDT